MAKSDILVRWKADTANYDANMAKAKRQLEQFGQQNMTAGGVVQQLSQKLMGTAAKFASFGAAASAAMKVAKDAFMFNEKAVDEWGRTVKSAESVYNGFLNAINTGDVSGFLSNINRIVSAAREAYDALDLLGTYNAFNKVNIASARAGLSGAIADYREGTGSKGAVSAASQELIDQLKTRQKLEQDAYEKAVADVARQRGVNPNDLLKVMTGKWGTFDQLSNMKMTGFEEKLVGAGFYARMMKVAAPANERERLAQVVQGLRDGTELEQLQTLGEQAKLTQIEIENQRKQTARVLRSNAGGTTTGGGGGGKTTATEIKAVTGSIDEQAKKVEDLRKAWRAAADDDSRQKIKKEIEEAEFALEILEGKSSGIPAMNYGLGDLAGKSGSGLFQEQAFKVDSSPKVTWKLDSKAMDALGKEIERINTKSEVKLNEKVADITGGVSQVVGGIEQLGIDVPEGMKNVLGGIQAVCTILTGISAIITAIQAIVAADAIIPFARGGVVHAANGYVTGNHYSGDLVPAMLNSGELVLNRAQQGNLASQLNDARGSAQLEAVITGEQLRLVLNNNGRRTGRGEVLTTKFY